MERHLGKRVKYDIVNEYGLTIVPAQSIINPESIALLQKHRIHPDSVLVEAVSAYADGKQPESESAELFRHTVEASRELLDSIRISRKVPLMDIRNKIIPAVKQVSANPHIFELFETVKAKDSYTYEHHIGVGVISTLIGRWLGLGDSELSTLSLAATLHDIGKVRISSDILNKPGKLSDEEFQLIKKHTVYGYEMLKDTAGLSHRIALVALQHHERDDGSGYPFGLRKEKIDPFSSIVAVADIFHAMSSKRTYHDPIPFHDIVNKMRQGKFGELNPHIVSVFLENLMQRLIGQQVILTDGNVGEVVYLNPHSIETPLVKVTDRFYDLSKEKELRIKDILCI